MTKEGKVWVYYPCVAVLLHQAQIQQLPCSCVVARELTPPEMNRVIWMCCLPFHMYRVSLFLVGKGHSV